MVTSVEINDLMRGVVLVEWVLVSGSRVSGMGCRVPICDPPHHQMRHKSEIQKLWFEHNVIAENIGFKMVQELCFDHN